MIEYITEEDIQEARLNSTIKFGPIGEQVYLRTYSRIKANGQNEDFYETAARVVNGNLNFVPKEFIEKGEAKKLFNLILNMEFQPAGRHLWATGTKTPYLNNCFEGNTRVHTTEGLKSLKDIVGEGVSVYTYDHISVGCSPQRYIGRKVVKGICNKHGEQELYEVVLSNGQRILSTKDHLWKVAEVKGTVRTIELKGKSIPYVLSVQKEYINQDEYRRGVCAGFVFGDGTRRGKSGSSVSIYGAARKDITPYYRDLTTESLSVGNSPKVIEKVASIIEKDDFTYVGRLPGEYKELPDKSCSHDYLLGWCRGLLAADGSASKQATVVICNRDKDVLEYVSEIMLNLGFVCFEPRLMRKENPFKEGQEAYMWQMSILRQSVHEEDLLLTHHKQNFLSKPINNYKSVECIDVIKTGRKETVYCLEVPEGNTFALEGWILTHNCYVSDFTERFSEHFEFLFMRLMEGGGVGSNYSNLFINSREGKPWIVKRKVNVHLLCHPEHKDNNSNIDLSWGKNVPFTSLLSEKYSYDYDTIDSDTQKYVRVEDSREGWTNVLVTLLESSMDASADLDLIVDVSNIRPRGSVLKGFGGKASGPDALMLLLDRVSSLLNDKLNKPLSSIDMMLIDHYIAQAVVSGGVRRSSRMSLKYWKDPDIFDFITCKEPGADGEIYHWTTNISVVVDNAFLRALKRGDEHAQAVYSGICKGMLNVGEPGIINASKCLEGESPQATFISTNPCGEIGMVRYPDLDCFDNCCLGHINLDRVQDPKEIARLAARFLIRATHSPVKDERQKANTEKNRRIGVGILGYHSWLSKNKTKYSDAYRVPQVANYLKKLYDIISEEARSYCSALRIPECIKKTTVAPTGCQRPDTLIYTDKGMLRLDELVDVTGQEWQDIDMKVFQGDTFEDATKGFVNGYAPTKVITLSSGLELEATHNHKYKILREGSKYFWCEASEIEPGDIFPVLIDKIRTEKYMNLKKVKYAQKRVCGAQVVQINQPEVLNEDLAWLLGVISGDGSVHNTGIRISCAEEDSETINKIILLCKDQFGIEPKTLSDPRELCVNVYINSKILLLFLQENGILKEKSKSVSIPKLIRTSPASVISSFIDGLWVADGSSNGRGSKYIDTISKQLAQQLIVLLRAIGQNASITTYTDRSKSIGDSTLYRVRFSGFGSLDFPIEKERYVNAQTRENTYQVRKLLGKHYYGDMVVDIQDSENMTLDLSVPNNNYYIANGVISHNSIGQLSGVSTGIQPVFSKFYIRRVRYSDSDPQLEGIKAKGYNVVKDPYAANTSVVEYVCVDQIYSDAVDLFTAEGEPDPEGLANEIIEDQADLSIEDFLSTQRMIQKEFVDNAISITINVDRNRYSQLDLESTIKHYIADLKGITIFPETSMPLTPYERITKEQLDSYEKSGYPIERGQAEQQCSLTGCPIK